MKQSWSFWAGTGCSNISKQSPALEYMSEGTHTCQAMCSISQHSLVPRHWLQCLGTRPITAWNEDTASQYQIFNPQHNVSCMLHDAEGSPASPCHATPTIPHWIASLKLWTWFWCCTSRYLCVNKEYALNRRSQEWGENLYITHTRFRLSVCLKLGLCY